MEVEKGIHLGELDAEDQHEREDLEVEAILRELLQELGDSWVEGGNPGAGKVKKGDLEVPFRSDPTG